MPEVVTASDVIKRAWEPAFRDVACVDTSADDVDGETLGYRQVEVPCPGSASGQVELDDRRETRCAERDVKGYAGPGHVLSVECRVPGENNSTDAESKGERHVYPARDGFAVESGVLSSNNAGCYQQ